MPKTKERSAEEYLRGKLREAMKEIRHLQKRIKELERHSHIPSQDEEIDNSVEDTFPKPEKLRKCAACGKGNIKTLDVMGRIFEQCELCGERKKVSGP